MDLNVKLYEVPAPRERGLPRLTRLSDRQSLLLSVVNFIRETSIPVDECTQVVTERQAVGRCGRVGLPPLLGEHASAKSDAVAVQFRDRVECGHGASLPRGGTGTGDQLWRVV